MFVPNAERPVAMNRGNALLLGTLDAEGEFKQTGRIEPQAGAQISC